MFRDEDPAAGSMEQMYMLLGKPGEPGSFPLTEPSISVLHAELHALPPTHIHVGGAEVMKSDSVEFGKKARAAGSPVRVTVYDYMWHTFTQFSEGCGGENCKPLQEAVRCIRQQGRFLKSLAPKPLRKPKFRKVESLKPEMRGVNVMLKCVSAPEKIEGNDTIFEFVGGDETGVVRISFRKDATETASVCKPGASLRLQNGHIKMVKGHIRLCVDKWAVLRTAEAPLDVVANEKKDMSATEYELTG